MAWLGDPNTRAVLAKALNLLRSTFHAVYSLSAAVTALIVEDKPQQNTPAVTARKRLANPPSVLTLSDGKRSKIAASVSADNRTQHRRPRSALQYWSRLPHGSLGLL